MFCHNNYINVYIYCQDVQQAEKAEFCFLLLFTFVVLTWALNYMPLFQFSYNRFHNILRLFENFPFAISERMRDGIYELPHKLPNDLPHELPNELRLRISVN